MSHKKEPTCFIRSRACQSVTKTKINDRRNHKKQTVVMYTVYSYSKTVLWIMLNLYAVKVFFCQINSNVHLLFSLMVALLYLRFVCILRHNRRIFAQHCAAFYNIEDDKFSISLTIALQPKLNHFV